MLNLAQVRQQIKPNTRILVTAPEHRRTVGTPQDAAVMGQFYRALKALGWQSTHTVHPLHRVSTLTLGPATICRHPAWTPGMWIVEIGAIAHEIEGDPETVTAAVSELIAPSVEAAPEIAHAEAPTAHTAPEIAHAEAEPLPKPLTPAAEAAQSLTCEYPALAGRIAAALEAVEAGLQSSYKTEWDNAGKYGTWSCNCPDATHRNPRTRYGVGCKHALAGVIRQRVEQAAMAVTMREVAHRQERRREPLAADVGSGRSILDMLDYTDPADYRPAADPVNLRSHGNRAEFRGIGHL